LGLIDPHGSLVDDVLKVVPQHRVEDVVLLDFTDADYPPCFNPFAGIPESQKGRAALCFLDVFKRVFGSSFNAQVEHLLRHSLSVMIDAPEGTLLGVNRMLTDEYYRRTVSKSSSDDDVKRFWQQEFQMWMHGAGAEAGAELLNKIGQIAAVAPLRNIFGQRDNLVDFDSLLDGSKIVLAKLPKAEIGEENALVIAGLLLSRLYLAASHRSSESEQSPDFFLYLDEFRNYIPESFDEMLREARKSNLCMTLSQQYLGEVSKELQQAILGNVGTLISFRVGAEDAATLSGEFAPRFLERDLVNLGVRDFLIKMSIEGEMKEAFSARTLRMHFPEEDLSEACVEYSRNKYSRLIPRLEREPIAPAATKESIVFNEIDIEQIDSIERIQSAKKV
jgi:hypothetical protein